MAERTEMHDVVVIGAGIVGVCCALEAQRQGRSVAIIDRLPPAEGASFGNAGVLGAQGVVPIGLPGLIKDVPKMLFDPLGPLVIRRRGFFSRTLPWLWLVSSRLAAGRGGTHLGGDASAAHKPPLNCTRTLRRRPASANSSPISPISYCSGTAPAVNLETLPWRLRRAAGGAYRTDRR